jgi:hypothetical protein
MWKVEYREIQRYGQKFLNTDEEFGDKFEIPSDGFILFVPTEIYPSYKDMREIRIQFIQYMINQLK